MSVIAAYNPPNHLILIWWHLKSSYTKCFIVITRETSLDGQVKQVLWDCLTNHFNIPLLNLHEIIHRNWYSFYNEVGSAAPPSFHPEIAPVTLITLHVWTHLLERFTQLWVNILWYIWLFCYLIILYLSFYYSIT